MITSPDVINSVLELGSAAIAWSNFYRIYKDRQVKGVHWINWNWYILWGFWDIFYIYPALNQPVTIYFATVKLIAHISWLSLAIYFLKYKRSGKDDVKKRYKKRERRKAGAIIY